ncbi:VCBS repeat-containing protein [Niabella drilacis]|uniref:Repeat domain-containing protein n=1 Tax=Niabella drilacis (strain DSM 25811 / CCM 8410 / CCUG 62505 / LMG 26954 / E90) TaxID=1285928 RepID=A0A1G7ACU1_NIADE|nr:VCBS repeat-containing protein [Niabella drilacis]SDE12609.1 Repeat domain-containing protein [Niabella drilacis]
MVLRNRQAPLLLLVCILHSIAGCRFSETKEPPESSRPLFTLLSPEQTQVHFANTLTEGPNTNVLMYEYFYNGGGVAVGDMNGDGLLDIYFSGNMVDNKLYLNKGNMLFEDITSIAGVAGRPGPWKTGVTVADVNGDGLPDIFASYSGKLKGLKRANQLFINKGNDAAGKPRFEDQAKEYGLADSAYNTQAYFFDMDKDGDLDVLLLNHNPSTLPVLDEAATDAILKTPGKETGIRLFKNENNHFSDITPGSGISSSPFTYGLGAGIADIDGDGWQDIYISNDYSAPDYLYINNRNGSFTNKIQAMVRHTSHFSMGNDIADINNDGLPDIYTLDMLPEDNRRQKLLFAPDNYEKFDLLLRTGCYYQYMRNMLQLNNGDGTFSEIGQVAGISNTDWSWAPLFADYDNDGLKDLYVTNGFQRDFTNMDFMKYMNDFLQGKGRLNREAVQELVAQIPSSNVTNYMFRNNGNLSFSNTGKEWGLAQTSNSNGAVYADLDNDGNLDLVVNNINAPAFIYKNNANTVLNHHYLDVQLKGSGKNTAGIGARVTVYSKGQQQLCEQMPSRGYQSTVSPVLHFGLGSQTGIDSLRIVWPGGKQQVLANIKADQRLTLEEKNAAAVYRTAAAPQPFFVEVKLPIPYADAVTPLNDFKRQPLLVNPLSFSGPCMAKGDVNNDGLDDVYIGGGDGKSAALFIQQKNGSFIRKPQPAFDADQLSEDADAVFTDINNDGYMDLYIASGGYHNYAADDPLLQDRVYTNDGKGTFTRNPNALPPLLVSKGCVRPVDINGDGFMDFFVGGRVVPGSYPVTPESYILVNNGKGIFANKTAAIAPQLQKLGMITDAVWVDVNQDNKKDLVVAGEWMPVSVFINNNGTLQNKTGDYFSKDTRGLWNRLVVDDFNKDGKPDIIAGNTGLNTQLKAGDTEPAEMYYKDFDNNGSIDPILNCYIQKKSYPYITRDELLDQISMMRTRFADYKSYADATLKEIFSAEEMSGAQHLQASHLQTSFFEMGADGKFHEKVLPVQAQFSPVFTISVMDYDKDGNKDLLLCGNINHARLRFGNYDASYGLLLRNDGKGNFSAVGQQQSGFHITGDVRSVLAVNHCLLFGINQQELRAYKLH